MQCLIGLLPSSFQQHWRSHGFSSLTPRIYILCSIARVQWIQCIAHIAYRICTLKHIRMLINDVFLVFFSLSTNSFYEHNVYAHTLFEQRKSWRKHKMYSLSVCTRAQKLGTAAHMETTQLNQLVKLKGNTAVNNNGGLQRDMTKGEIWNVKINE